MTESCHFDDEKSLGAAFVFGGPVCINTGIACRFLVPSIYALSGGISSNKKRGRLHPPTHHPKLLIRCENID